MEINKINTGYKNLIKQDNKIEKERKSEETIRDSFKISSYSEIHPTFLAITSSKEEKETAQTEIKVAGEKEVVSTLMTSPLGTIADLDNTQHLASIKAAHPLFEVFPGAKKDEAKKLAESLICEGGLRPDVKETIIRDLTAFPLPILRLFKNDKLDIVVVKEGQSMADTSFLTVIKPEEYSALSEKGKVIFDDVVKKEAENTAKEIEEEKKKGNDDEFHIAMINHWEGDRIADSLSAKLINGNLGFTPVKTSDPVSLKVLAEKNMVSEEDYPEWEKTLKLINGDHIEIKDGMINPKHRVFVSPYTYYKGQPVSETTLKCLQHYDSKEVKSALGIHLWQDRLVILHEDYAADPGLEVGHYRIILHECGHAMDHAIERIPGELGENHRKTIDALFKKDMENFKKNGKNNFISPRAMDNVREYFAEAVESYLTVIMGDKLEYYKPDDNNFQLKKLNPELYDYIDKIMRTDFPPDLTPVPPEKDPEGVKAE